MPSAAPTTPLPTAAGVTFAPSSSRSTAPLTAAPYTSRPTAVGAVPTVHVCPAADVSACGSDPCVPSERGHLCDCGGGEAVALGDHLGTGSGTDPCRDVDVPRVAVPPFDDLPTVSICSALDQDNCEDQACVVDFQRDPMCLCENGLGGAGCSISPCGVGLVPFGAGRACVAPQPQVLIPNRIGVPVGAAIGHRIALVNATVVPATRLGRVTFSVSGWRAVGGDGGGGAGPSPVAVVRVDGASLATLGMHACMAQAVLYVAAPLPDDDGISALRVWLTATYGYRGVSNSTTVELQISMLDVATGGGDRNGSSPDSSTNDRGGSDGRGLPGYFLAFILLGGMLLVGVGVFCWCARKKPGAGEGDDADAKCPAANAARADVVFENPSFGMGSEPGYGDSGVSQSRSSKHYPTYAAATPPVAYDQASATPIAGTAVYSRASGGGGTVGLTAAYVTASPSTVKPATGAVYDTASSRLTPIRPPKTTAVYDMARSGGSGSGDSDGYLEVQGLFVPSPMYDKASSHRAGGSAVNNTAMHDRAGVPSMHDRAGGGGGVVGKPGARPALRATPTYDMATGKAASPTAPKAGGGTVYQVASSSA